MKDEQTVVKIVRVFVYVLLKNT